MIPAAAGPVSTAVPTQQIMDDTAVDSAVDSAINASCAPNAYNKACISLALVSLPTSAGITAAALCHKEMATMPGYACATPAQTVGHWCCVGLGGLSAAAGTVLCMATCAYTLTYPRSNF